MADTIAKSQLKYISPSDILANPENPRLIFRQDEMESLLVSINEHGIQVPLAVYIDGKKFRLIDGERRWRCAVKLNLPTVPALVQKKPTPLENLLLMYNIHALREQWDYFTIASKLADVIELFLKEKGYEPNEVELSTSTGLSRGQIRRCKLLMDLPDRFKKELLAELHLPKSRQKLSEDFFIEMEKSLKTVVRRIPEYAKSLDSVRSTLIKKFRTDKITAITDFRLLSKIATSIDNLDVAHKSTRTLLDRVFNPNDPIGIKQAYENSVEFGYDEKKAEKQIVQLREYLEEIISEDQTAELDDNFIEALKRLRDEIDEIIKVRLSQ
jgi:ParB family chromosome partitioning protein